MLDSRKPGISNRYLAMCNTFYYLSIIESIGHFVLFDLKNHMITYYNSLPRQITIAQRDALLKLANNFKIETSQSTFQHGDQAKQENFYDCGILVLITSLHIFADSIGPPSYDCSLWSAFFRALLTGKCQTELPAMKWKISPSTKVEDEDSM